MATFELTDQSGAVYHIDAPDENAAVAALAQATGGGKSAPASAPQAAQPAPQSGEFKLPVRSFAGDADSVVRALANGVTFGQADRLAAAANSGDYADNLANERAKTQQFNAEHPVISTGLNIVGSAAVPLGAIGAAAKGATLGAKTLMGMGAGAGIGGLQGALESPDWTDLPQVGKDAAFGAGTGAAIGGVLPGAGQVIGAGVRKGADLIRGGIPGMSRSASDHLISAVTADTPAAVQAQMARLGPDATLADAGPALLGKTQGAALNSDEGRSILQGVLRQRNEGTNARIMGDVNAALGPAEDPQTVANAIRARRSAVDAQAYPAALNNAPAVDTTNLLTNLGPMIGGSVGMERKALTNLRDMLMTEKQVPRLDPQTGYHMTDAKGTPLFDSVPTPQTDPNILHKIKGELDNVIQYDQPGLGIPAAALSRQQGALKAFRGQLNDALEQQVPGYAQANAQSAGLARRGEAVEQGTQYLGSGKTTPSPDRFADEFAQRAPGEQIAFAKGSRGNIERILGTKANDLQALRGELQGEGGWNTAKLGTVHGQDAADQLVNSVDRNLKFRDTYNKVVENSQTAQRTAAANAMKPEPPGEVSLVNPNMTLTGLVGAGAKKAVNKVVDAIRRDPTASYGDIASVLAAQGPQRDAHLQAILDAIGRRRQNSAVAPIVGGRAALVAAILANAELNNRMKTQR